MKKIIALGLVGLSAVAFGGVHADAVAVAKEQGIGIDDMKGVPGEFRVGDFGFKVTIRNLEEKPLRGDVHFLVAESDDEEPKFRSLASGHIDLTLKSVKADPVTLELKGTVSPDLLWRDVKVVIAEATGKEVVLSDGYVNGTGRRPERLRKKEATQRKFVWAKNSTRADEEIKKGDDLYPDGFRVAFIAKDGEADLYEESAERADWDVEDIYKSDAKGWRKLAKNLDDYDAVVTLAGFPEEIDGAAFTNFIAKGGCLWVNGAGAREDLFGLAAFVGTNRVPDVKIRGFKDDDTDNHLARPGDRRDWWRDSFELQYPEWGNLVEHVPNTMFAFNKPQGQAWSTIGASASGNTAQLIRHRYGKGVIYVSATPSADAQFYANLRYHVGLQTQKGLAFCNHWETLGWFCFPEQGWFRRSADFGASVANLWPEPCELKMTVTATDAFGHSRTAYNFAHGRRANIDGNKTGLGLQLDCYGLYGQTGFKMVIESPTRDYRTEIDLGTFRRPNLLEIRPPFYRGWVSPYRQKSDVTVGVTVYDDGAVGEEVTLETYDTEGRLLARQTGTVEQYRREDDRSVWFEVPVPQDAPCGEYRLVARMEADEGTVTSESKFEIRAVEPGQVMYDQDGMLMNEGKRFYAYGCHHPSFPDDPIGPWIYDTNRNEEVVAPGSLKEDGTPFTLWDVGFTYCQNWEMSWTFNFSSDIEKLKWWKDHWEARSLVWAYWGRGKIYRPWFHTPWPAKKYLNEMCIKMIDEEPNFFEKLAAKNAERAKRAHEAGLLFSIESGLPAYHQALYENIPPWEWKLGHSWQRNDAKQVRDIIRGVLKNDPYHTVGGWYVLDEGGAGQDIYDQDNVAREEDKLHPLMLLGELNALHGPVDIGCDQVHPDTDGFDAHRINALFNWGLSNRGVTAPHGGSIICCHRAAQAHVAQNYDTLWTLELSAIATGLNGSMLYAWRQDNSPEDAYGSGWSVTRPRELQRICRQLKALYPYIMNGLGTATRSFDSRVRARLCGDEAKDGRALLLVNFERLEKMTATLHMPELAGKTLVPLFEENAKPVKVDVKGDFSVEFEPDASRVMKVEG